MPTDKIKNPSLFPAPFPAALTYGIGKHLILGDLTEAEGKSIARKYRAFLRSIKAYPLHPLNGLLVSCDVRTQRELIDGTWWVFALVKKKINWASALSPPDNLP